MKTLMNFEMFLYFFFIFSHPGFSFEMLNSIYAVAPFVYINVGSLSVMVVYTAIQTYMQYPIKLPTSNSLFLIKQLICYDGLGQTKT